MIRLNCTFFSEALGREGVGDTLNELLLENGKQDDDGDDGHQRTGHDAGGS